MRNVILFVVAAAAAALVADANPSTGHAHIAALLRRQLPGSSTSSSSFPAIDPSSITANSKCQSPCSPFTNTNAVEACSAQLSCLCGQQNYNSLASCFQCVSPSSVSSILSSFVSSCQELGFSLGPPSGSSSKSGTTSPGTTSPGTTTPNTNSTGSTGSDSPSSGNAADPFSSSLSQYPSVTGPRAGDSTPTSGNSPFAAKSNGGVVGPNAFGAVGLSAVAAVVVMIATSGASFFV